MNFREIPFFINGVDGKLELKYSFWGWKLYQNNRKLKRKGLTYKYNVTTTDGSTDLLKIGAPLIKRTYATFRDETIYLEERLSVYQQIVMALPIALCYGGAIGAAIGFLGCAFLSGYVRAEENKWLQLLVSLGVLGVGFFIYYIIATIFLTGMYGMWHIFN